MPDAWEQGWGVYEVRCFQCGWRWVIVVPAGSVGYDCPYCHYHDETVKHEDGIWTIHRMTRNG